jgi:hypothetical protein
MEVIGLMTGFLFRFLALCTLRSSLGYHLDTFPASALGFWKRDSLLALAGTKTLDSLDRTTHAPHHT